MIHSFMVNQITEWIILYWKQPTPYTAHIIRKATTYSQHTTAKKLNLKYSLISSCFLKLFGVPTTDNRGETWQTVRRLSGWLKWIVTQICRAMIRAVFAIWCALSIKAATIIMRFGDRCSQHSQVPTKLLVGGLEILRPLWTPFPSQSRMLPKICFISSQFSSPFCRNFICWCSLTRHLQ